MILLSRNESYVLKCAANLAASDRFWAQTSLSVDLLKAADGAIAFGHRYSTGTKSVLDDLLKLSTETTFPENHALQRILDSIILPPKSLDVLIGEHNVVVRVLGDNAGCIIRIPLHGHKHIPIRTELVVKGTHIKIDEVDEMAHRNYYPGFSGPGFWLWVNGQWQGTFGSPMHAALRGKQLIGVKSCVQVVHEKFIGGLR